MQGTRGPSPVWEDPTCCRAKKVHDSYWPLAHLKWVVHSKRSHCSEKPSAKPLLQRSSLLAAPRASLCTARKTQHNLKQINTLKIKTNKKSQHWVSEHEGHGGWWTSRGPGHGPGRQVHKHIRKSREGKRRGAIIQTATLPNAINTSGLKSIEDGNLGPCALSPRRPRPRLLESVAPPKKQNCKVLPTKEGKKWAQANQKLARLSTESQVGQQRKQGDS